MRRTLFQSPYRRFEGSRDDCASSKHSARGKDYCLQSQSTASGMLFLVCLAFVYKILLPSTLSSLLPQPALHASYYRVSGQTPQWSGYTKAESCVPPGYSPPADCPELQAGPWQPAPLPQGPEETLRSRTAGHRTAFAHGNTGRMTELQLGMGGVVKCLLKSKRSLRLEVYFLLVHLFIVRGIWH